MEGSGPPKKQKLDPSGVPFSTRTRGGKKQKKADARAEQTAAGEREPKEYWSEAKRDAYNRLQSLAERRRELSVLEAKAREDFQAAGGEVQVEVEVPLASASRGSGDQDFVEVEVPEEASGSGIYSDLAAASEASEGFYSAEAHSTRGPSSVVRGRSRTRTPRPSSRIQEDQAPPEEGPEEVPAGKPEPPGSRYIVPKSARRKAKKATTEPKVVPETPRSPKKAESPKSPKKEQPETIETPRGPALAPRPKSRPKIASKPAEIEEVIPKSKSRPKVASKPAEPEEETPKHTKTSPKPVSRVPVLSATVEARELP